MSCGIPSSWVFQFQSPSLRGSGRFKLPRGMIISITSGFNPLHCGAVVASRQAAQLGAPPPCFNPLHCGAVVASDRPRHRGRSRRRVSIPFLAGQWSLHEIPFGLPSHEAGFNPLHCGAVVASGSRHRNKIGFACFNPLHCGAVVASDVRPRDTLWAAMFQSPSLRGSGRFNCWW